MTELDRLRRDCAIAGKLWNRTFSAVLLSAMRSHGGAMLDRLWAALLLSHQDEYFVASLQKLKSQMIRQRLRLPSIIISAIGWAGSAWNMSRKARGKCGFAI